MIAIKTGTLAFAVTLHPAAALQVEMENNKSSSAKPATLHPATALQVEIEKVQNSMDSKRYQSFSEMSFRAVTDKSSNELSKIGYITDSNGVPCHEDDCIDIITSPWESSLAPEPRADRSEECEEKCYIIKEIEKDFPDRDPQQLIGETKSELLTMKLHSHAKAWKATLTQLIDTIDTNDRVNVQPYLTAYYHHLDRVVAFVDESHNTQPLLQDHWVDEQILAINSLRSAIRIKSLNKMGKDLDKMGVTQLLDFFIQETFKSELAEFKTHCTDVKADKLLDKWQLGYHFRKSILDTLHQEFLLKFHMSSTYPLAIAIADQAIAYFFRQTDDKTDIWKEMRSKVQDSFRKEFLNRQPKKIETKRVETSEDQYSESEDQKKMYLEKSSESFIQDPANKTKDQEEKSNSEFQEIRVDQFELSNGSIDSDNHTPDYFVVREPTLRNISESVIPKSEDSSVEADPEKDFQGYVSLGERYIEMELSFAALLEKLQSSKSNLLGNLKSFDSHEEYDLHDKSYSNTKSKMMDISSMSADRQEKYLNTVSERNHFELSEISEKGDFMESESVDGDYRVLNISMDQPSPLRKEQASLDAEPKKMTLLQISRLNVEKEKTVAGVSKKIVYHSVLPKDRFDMDNLKRKQKIFKNPSQPVFQEKKNLGFIDYIEVNGDTKEQVGNGEIVEFTPNFVSRVDSGEVQRKPLEIEIKLNIPTELLGDQYKLEWFVTNENGQDFSKFFPTILAQRGVSVTKTIGESIFPGVYTMIARVRPQNGERVLAQRQFTLKVIDGISSQDSTVTRLLNPLFKVIVQNLNFNLN